MLTDDYRQFWEIVRLTEIEKLIYKKYVDFFLSKKDLPYFTSYTTYLNLGSIWK